jgi:hypothetical protein
MNAWGAAPRTRHGLCAVLDLVVLEQAAGAVTAQHEVLADVEAALGEVAEQSGTFGHRGGHDDGDTAEDRRGGVGEEVHAVLTFADQFEGPGVSTHAVGCSWMSCSAVRGLAQRRERIVDEQLSADAVGVEEPGEVRGFAVGGHDLGLDSVGYPADHLGVEPAQQLGFVRSPSPRNRTGALSA